LVDNKSAALRKIAARSANGMASQASRAAKAPVMAYQMSFNEIFLKKANLLQLPHVGFMVRAQGLCMRTPNQLLLDALAFGLTCQCNESVQITS
jgi:hypothetical protein